ncbi:MAG: hypothetical protein IKJ68_04120 [Clostridia bacterium]|nr:hypothetical protein [Clostridia bacterium]
MLKTFKKSIALFVALVFVLSMVPFAAMAEVTEEPVKLYMVNYANTRSGSSNAGVHQGYGMYTSVRTSMGGGSNDRYSVAQIDFAGYEEILANENTKMTLNIKSGATSKYGIYDFTVGIVSDNCDDYDPETVTHNILSSLGYFNESDVLTLYTRSDATAAGANVILTSDLAASDILSKLNTGSDDSVVSFRFAGLTSTSSYFAATEGASSYVTIDYDASEIDNEAYVNSWVDNMVTIDDLVGEEGIEAGLPLKYHGMDIAWESSDPDYISNDGKVTQHIEPKDVTLTATFSYKGADANAQMATATKEFVVTVEGETPVEVTIPFTNYAYSRPSAKGNDDAKNTIYKRQTHEETTVQSITTGGSFDAYTQLDLKGYEEILKNPHTSIQMKLTAGFRYSTSRIHNLEGVLAPDRADSYNWETVTWNIADDIGLHETEGRPVLFTKNDDKRISNGSTVTLDANKDALLSVLSENDTNSVVSIHFDPLDWNGPVESDQNYSDSTIRGNDANTCLVITYYESEIDNDEFFADIESTFAWDTITSDAQEAVVNDLPNYYKGADIVWSSAEGYVTSSGELAIPSDSAMVEDTITANVSYNGNTFTREFTVKLCDGSLAVGTPSLIVDGGVATGSVEVTNATGADVEYQLYIAVYSDKELVDLVPVKLTAGKGSKASETVNANVADGNSVKFLVWEYGKTTPATVAVEK